MSRHTPAARTPQARPPLLKRLARRIRRALLPTLLAVGSAAALAAPPKDRLTLLVPDDAVLTNWQVKVWLDAAADQGIRVQVLTDSQLLSMGSSAASRIAALVVPDGAHQRASAAVTTAIKQYAYLGGNLMFVYDAGVLDERGFYPLSGNSRFADMVGVDYAFWNNGEGAATMVGFGPVVGTKARLDALEFPPGKYLPYTPPATLANATSATTAYVPTSAADPTGTASMTTVLRKRAEQAIEDGSSGIRSRRAQSLRNLLGIGIEAGGVLRYDRRKTWATPARDQHYGDRVWRYGDEVAAAMSADGRGYTEMSVPSGASTDTTLNVISGYGYGPLGYFSYVTAGTYTGQVLLSSPEHGLVAGQRAYGSGQVLFVNLPLGYFKAIGTDGAPLHGFLDYFARDHMKMATMSMNPRGRGSLVYNWHVDDGDDLNTDVKYLLENTRVLNRGPFSIHFTAGPDVINPGDGNGMNLPGNATSRANVKRLADLSVKHAIGSHGGWIHDFWGVTANEGNKDTVLPLLTKNFNAIEAVTGKTIREYSSPVGNTPRWALEWMEARGVIASYLVADLGVGLHRPWRDGSRLTNKLWASPVTPLGAYATFEEFDAFGISDATSGQWLLDLQSFAINHRTNRMFYNHPPGAKGHLGPVNAVLSRSDGLVAAKRFAWTTMTELAEFSQRRVETDWDTSNFWGARLFSASHASSLANQTWLLPKSRYTLPIVIGGWGSVGWDNKNWIVTAEGGTSLKFIAYEN